MYINGYNYTAPRYRGQVRDTMKQVLIFVALHMKIATCFSLMYYKARCLQKSEQPLTLFHIAFFPIVFNLSAITSKRLGFIPLVFFTVRRKYCQRFRPLR